VTNDAPDVRSGTLLERAVSTKTGGHMHRVALAVVAAMAVAASTLLAPWSPTPAEAAEAPTLTFATWNICKLDCPGAAPSWDVRRERVARVIGASGADVISINEATNNQSGYGTQWEDVQHLAARKGYAAPTIDDDRCQRQCDHTARLLFRTSTAAQLDLGRRATTAGSWPIREIAPAVSAYPLRQVSWAYLVGTKGGGVFLAVSAHLTNDKSAAGERDRVAFGRAVSSWAARMNAERGLTGAPVILMGDLNSFDERQPRGVQRVLRAAGWTDAHTAPSRRNIDVHTMNYLEGGWPARPVTSAGRPANRLDYIFLRGPVQPRSYEVVTHVDRRGRFKVDYQASDHNMVRATIAFTAPVDPGVPAVDRSGAHHRDG
jgi:endonuclease/exonuclease/phosphatase family metal-dependent hydrolase